MCYDGSMRYDILLWDVDQTLLDFKASERWAIREGFKLFGRDISDGDIAVYSGINDRYWKLFEKGEVSKERLLVGRFEELFARLGISDMDPQAFEDFYQSALGDVYFYLDESYKLIAQLRGRCRQYVISNGTALAQRKKLALSKLGDLMDGVFISEEMGHPKPEKAFFDLCEAAIPDFVPARALVIGDSLTSDIRGANNAGLPCCWYNPGHKERPAELRIDHEIDNLWKILSILDEDT